LVTSLKSDSNTKIAACAFCDARIGFGESICPACMKKYNIRSYDLANDGCGCDI
jgi:predicted amidophosphoribosyltransferase